MKGRGLLALMVLVPAFLWCGAPASSRALDPDGVEMLLPSVAGLSFRLGGADPNAVQDLVIERGTRATPLQEGARRFWNLPSHPLAYASGGRGWTSRIHIRASGSDQRFTWKDQQGFLSRPEDAKNLEFTVFLRVHGLLDPARAGVTLKVRGGGHGTRHPDRASCVMMTFTPERRGAVTRFGKELAHPRYDYVTLQPRFTASLREGAWFGLKLVSWNDPADVSRVVHRLYLDTDPFEGPARTLGNHWSLFSEYVDEEGKSTGQYDTLVDWGGWQTTLRTDGFRDIDFTLLSLREIQPPCP